MTVGRFFKGGHNKRQDLVIEVVRQLSERFGRDVPLIMAGALHATADSRQRFRELQAMADGIDCHFYPNVSREKLAELYSHAAVLVHPTGLGVDKYGFPERLEHFGIVPIEAASLGCIPVVYGEGGPAEVMRILQCGTTFRSIPEAVERVNGLFADSDGAGRLSRDLIEKSQLFSREVFRHRVSEALVGVL
jgi:glycosyltransferase involved in cell wall biosynthesis